MLQDRGVRPALVVLVTLVLGPIFAGCGISAPSGSGQADAADGTTTPAAPALAEADALSDPRAWDGPSTAVVPDAAVRPVETDVTPQLPATVTDAQGTKVTVTDASRILALDVYGTLARTVFELGLGDRVVGRDVSTQFAEAAQLPLVTPTGHDLSAEAILELDPTVIITDTTLGPWDVVLQLRDSGIPVLVVDSHRGLDNLRQLTEQVAAALGVPEQGQALADRTDAEVAAVQAEVAGVAPAEEGRKLRMVFLYVRGQSGVYYMFGEGSGADGLIDALGGYDVAQEIGWNGMKPVTDEGIIDAQPDLVLMMTKGLESAGGVDGLLERLPALASTPAGEHRRFVDMEDSQILGYGPLTADVLNALAVAVYAPGSVS
ncbi:MAG TPA: ABC transporter substrate-binding protein [Nocardioides sp.]|uniref:heme/hemin ABC transporter substrate-binding protein n=1 Tax=uncultured Nocardioides sp. TaxID=198441 RepID=UPI00262DD7CC|nr:ABC transporter substrate-binding protein [uncultured Nocardioides sp.]HRI95818.1 ABC transporter substrate-binding protein [Nocardioides sp.]HRK45963.1 ABC transporter substrate-binding protein [Nocardioides sp.]